MSNNRKKITDVSDINTVNERLKNKIININVTICTLSVSCVGIGNMLYNNGYTFDSFPIIATSIGYEASLAGLLLYERHLISKLNKLETKESREPNSCIDNIQFNDSNVKKRVR